MHIDEKEKTILDHLMGPKPQKQVNVRIDVDLYEEVEKQMEIDKMNGLKVSWAAVVRAGLKQFLYARLNPNYGQKIKYNYKKKKHRDLIQEKKG